MKILGPDHPAQQGRNLPLIQALIQRWLAGQDPSAPEARQKCGALAGMVSVVAAQLFAYYCSVQRGLDPDKPRNLAKSVTVE